MAEEMLDSHVSIEQAKLAIGALHKHANKVQKDKEEVELLPGREQHIWLVVGTKRVYPEGKLKPFRIPIKHVIVDPREANICLITKDPQREYKDLLEQHNIKFISRVVGIEKLKGKWKPFEARRLLLKENGLFLADDRVIPLLPKLLGKVFFEAKKQPIPVRLTKKDLRTELENAINSTYMHQNQGNCTSIKIATLNHTPAQILENLQTALPAIVSRIRDGWENIQNLHIKTSNSTSLPIWTCDLSDGPEGRWHGLTHAKEEEWGGIEPGGLGDSKSPSSGSPPLSKPPKRKGADEDHPSKIAKKVRGEVAETTVTPSSNSKSKSKSTDIPPSTPISKQTRSISTVDVTVPSIDTAKKLSKPLKEPPAKERSHKAVVSKPYDKKPKSKAVDITVKESVPLKSAMKKSQPKVSTSLSTEEVKRKKVQVIGVEKKKQKLGKVGNKRHGAGAKVNLIGKKRP